MVSIEYYVAILAIDPAPLAGLRLYPNPTQGRLTVEADAPATGPLPTVRLFDARGILRQEQPMTRTINGCLATLDLSTLPAGTFFVQLNTEATQTAVVKAVIKQ